MAGVNGNIMHDYLCFCCNLYGHTRHFYPEPTENGGSNEVRNFTFIKVYRSIICTGFFVTKQYLSDRLHCFAFYGKQPRSYYESK